MSIGFANAFVAGMRYNGVRVEFEPGWERRGNGQSFPPAGPEGPLTHHTGADYDGGYSTLVRGRSDLRGPLCNICTWADGHITLIAAHPANHAGAAGGSWARPYPDTRNFNRLVWGNEVMFPGLRPWTPAQYRTARIAAAVVCGIRRRGSEWAKAHYETSVTGKWDPGVGNGRAEWFPFDRFRAEMQAALTQEDDMPTADELWRHPIRNVFGQDVPAHLIVSATEGRVKRLEDVVLGERQSAVVEDGRRSGFKAPWHDFLITADKHAYEGAQNTAARFDDLEAKLDLLLSRIDPPDRAPGGTS